MKLIHETAFISEIIFQTKIISYAVEKLNKIDEQDKISIWSSIQSILISSGNISKILWPIKKYEKRGKHLRILLKINDDSVLKSRKFRNVFEHYDEKIDNVFQENDITTYVDFAMNPSLSSSIRNRCHRGYNTYNNTLMIHGEDLDLKEIIKAINKIKINCENLFLKPLNKTTVTNIGG